MELEQPAGSRSSLRSPAGLALCAFLAIALFFLLTEHRAHTLGVLPWLLLLACPLLHMFHGGHAGHTDHTGRGHDRSDSGQGDQP
jgi:hypothetical protein